MRASRNIVTLVAVAGAAFIAGRVITPGEALAQQKKDKDHPHAQGKDHPRPHGEQAGPPMSEEAMKRMMAMEAVGTPGANHEVLNSMLGRWQGTFKMWMEPGAEPMELPGTATREWIMDGRYVQETVESPRPDGSGTFRGLAIIGYNNLDGVYEYVWVDNHSTQIHFWTGSYNPDTESFSWRGACRDPLTKKVCNLESTLDSSDPSRQAMVGYSTTPDGRQYKCFEGVFTKQQR